MTREEEHQFGRDFSDEIVDWIGSTLKPEEIFDDEALTKWAEANGFEKKQDGE